MEHFHYLGFSLKGFPSCSRGCHWFCVLLLPWLRSLVHVRWLYQTWGLHNVFLAHPGVNSGLRTMTPEDSGRHSSPHQSLFIFTVLFSHCRLLTSCSSWAQFTVWWSTGGMQRGSSSQRPRETSSSSSNSSSSWAYLGWESSYLTWSPTSMDRRTPFNSALS